MSFKEPDIIINDHKLSNGESMTVRVAINSFIDYLNNNSFGDDNDKDGKFIHDGYLKCCKMILVKMGVMDEKDIGGK